MMRRESKKTRRSIGLVRLIRPSMRFYFVVLVLFCSGAFALRCWELGVLELLVLLLVLLYTRLYQRMQKKEVLEYIGASGKQLQDGATNAMMTMPMPMAIFKLRSGRLLWGNEAFLQITGEREHIFEIGMAEMVPGFGLGWLAEGHEEAPALAVLGDRKYRVYGSVFRLVGSSLDEGYWGITYFMDVTEYEHISREYQDSRPIVAVLLLDSYEDLIKNLTETAKSALLAQIDHRISEWCGQSGGYLCRFDRDRYIYIFEERHLRAYTEGRFSLLDTVRELQSPNGVTATLSIGVGRGAASLDEGYQFAMLGIDMALSRGGDQAVVKTPQNFEFYGGKTVALERRTKVKSRVVASALGELIGDASNLLIMGHKHADLDCIGTAAALCCIARKKGKNAHIVVEKDHVAQQLIARLQKLPEYEGVFMSPQEGMVFADSKTLLVVVDTNRPDQVESPDLLQSCSKVVVIDHHRRAAEYIADAALNFHEPYASSAGELAAELLQYLVESADILKGEAEATLSGIMLDTKNFTMRTGSRTFEAAAFLRRCGADTTEIKKLLQNDFKSTVARYAIMQNAELYRSGIAIAVCPTGRDRIVAAQAADELVNIAGIETSFVLYHGEETVNLSARSIGEVNVQVILEKLGGGGNRATAGAQLGGITMAEAARKLKTAIDEYLEQDLGTEGKQ